jgi:hypothetical protein
VHLRILDASAKTVFEQRIDLVSVTGGLTGVLAARVATA